ncbi:MAG: hypothetical protein ACRD2I_12325 [Vicinamibacterales bacterium]
MEFQEYAAREVSALIDRLSSDAEERAEALLDGSHREHEAAMKLVRAQLDAQTRQLETRVKETEQLTTAGEQVRAQLAALRAEADSQQADLEAQRRETEEQRRMAAANASAKEDLQKAQAALKAAEVNAQRLEAEYRANAQRFEAEHEKSLSAAAAAAVEKLQAAQAAQKAAETHAHRLETEHQRSLAAAKASAKRELQSAQAALDAALAEAGRLETEQQRSLEAVTLSAAQELASARKALDAAKAESQRVEGEHHLELTAASAAADHELSAARAALDAARAELRRLEVDRQHSLAARDAEGQELIEARAARDAAAQELVDARSALEAAQAEAERLTRQFDVALEELRDEHVSTLKQQAVARTVLPLDELLSVFGSLASASTPSAVLTNVVSGLGREFSRVALFRVRGGRLECVSHVGFEFEGDVAKIVIPTTVDSLMTRAVNSKRTQTFISGSSDEPCTVPFGGTPACAVALPLISGDAPVAVVYADDSDQLEFGSVPAELLVKFAELVWQHAILVLQRASAAQKMLAVAPVHNFERLA